MYRITGYLIGGDPHPPEYVCTARTPFGAFIKMLFVWFFFDDLKLEEIPEEGSE